MEKKYLLSVGIGYLMWGVLPLYWALLNNLDPIFVLSNRIIWSAGFTVLLLALNKRMGMLKATFRDWKQMKFLIPAAVAVTLNWGIYIWAVNDGRVMDASLGYYMNPLFVFLCGVLIFKEKCGKLEIIALGLALAGVLISTIQFGNFPFVALSLALSFVAYGVFKRFAQADGLTSVAVETLIVMPIMLVLVIFLPTSHASMSVMTAWQVALLVGAGVVTATPLVLYSLGVNKLPFIVVGFLQYISPTCMLIIGLAEGAPFGLAQAVSFGCIWAGLIVFSIGMHKKNKAAAKLAEKQAA